jgi:PAS domain S-box-containing protein
MESDNYLKTIFDFVQVGLMIIDPKTHSIIDVNPAAVEMIGIDRGKIIGSFCHQFNCPVEVGKCPITDLGQGIDNSECIFIRADGSQIPVVKTAIPITINGNNYLIASFTDIGKRKKMEKAMLESETMFKDLAERALVGIYLFQDGIFRYVNPKFADISGYRIDEIIDVLGPKTIVNPDDWPLLEEKITTFLSGDSKSARNETRILTKNGEIRSIELTGSKTQYQGRPAVLGTILDITDRKLAEETLRESNRFIEEIINTIPVRVFWKDRDLVFLGCNTMFAHDAGFADSKDVVGKDDYEMVWHDQAELYRADDRQVIESGRSKLFIEEPQTTPEGDTKALLTSKIPLRSSEGEIIGVLGTYMDITERKKMETALLESKEYLDKIINSVADPIFVIDRQHRHVLVNEAMCELSNRTREEFIGKTPFDFFPREQVDVFVKNNEAVFETGKENVSEETITDSKGVIRTIITKKSLYTDASGNKSIVGIIRDITDRKKEEEKLKDAYDQLHAIIDFLPDATFVIDKEGKVIAWNRAIEAMTGILAVDILGKGNYEYSIPFYGERRPILIDLVLRRVKEIEDKYAYIERKEGTLEGEAYMPNMKGGALYLFGKASVLYDSAGNLFGAIESIRDITERKNAELIRERLVNELESKNAEMERFTYTVSHDLRSPLITVSGLVGFLKSDLEKGNTTRIDIYFTRIINALTKMDKLLESTLELSRIGRIANPPSNIPFDDIIQDALIQVQERIKKCGMKITVAKDMPDVYVDPMRIAEVMVNLIENSIKYMGDQPNPEIVIGHQLKNDKLTFFVKDNGIGIDPSQHEKIFELFYQIDDKSEGTGAGLAIVKRIIEVQGGSIWVESEKGKGSTIYFTLPYQPSSGG